jgi:GNAT superfamily N-acetyltransferase
LKLREANQTDATRIAALHATSWRGAYRGMLSEQFLDGDILSERKAVWVGRLTEPPINQKVVLAEINDELAGFACAFGSEDPELGTLLDNLHVYPQFQRQGVGARLMNEIVCWCRAERPHEGLFLWVLEANLPARRFYDNLCGEQVGAEVWHSPDGGALPSLCYAWKDLAALAERLNSKLLK